jgi:DNA-binding response OmpR family regulator
MQRVLIVEDEPAMRMGLKDNLEFEGYSVEMAEDGEIGLEKIRSGNYDIILLDVMMPKISGFDVCRTIRSEGIDTPVILLTARGEEIDKVLGLELGADDYVTKPFSVRELSARIKSILRRSVGNSETHEDHLIIGRLEVDFSQYSAKTDGREVRMSHKEFEILKYLRDHKNQLVSRFDLLENIWGYEEQPTTRTVDNFIVRLRQKIETNPNHPKIILTVHGAGYKLID